MTTPIFTCGFECRWSGYPTIMNHWTDTRYPQCQNTYARNSGYAARLSCTAEYRHLQHQIETPAVTLVGRVYLYLVSLPAADVAGLIAIANNYGATWTIGFTQATQKLNAGILAGSRTDASSTISAGTWYRIDFKTYLPSGAWTFDWQIDGTAQTQCTAANSSALNTYFYVGPNTGTETFDAAYDDVLLSSTSGDYPLGAGQVIGYLVTSTSGTHNQTSGDLQNEASSNVTNGDSSGGKVNETSPDTTSYVKQVIARVTTYWEGIYDTSGVTSIPRAVDQMVATRAVTAGANDQKSQLYDGTSAADAYALTSTPSTGLLYQRKQWATAPSTGAWTLAKFQAARIRWGFGTVNTATYPPAISYTILEAEFGGGGPQVATAGDSLASLTETPGRVGVFVRRETRP